MLLLDFCNVQKWSTEKISSLYNEYKIIHTSEGSKYGTELFCYTKHREGWRYYFTSEIPPFLDELTSKFCISPNQPEHDTLWENLNISQQEYRMFLDQCISGNLDVSYLNDLSKGFTLRFTDNHENVFLPRYSFELPKINCIESYLEQDILNIGLNRIGPWLRDLGLHNINLKRGEESLIGRIRRCPNCGRYFIFTKRHSLKYCDDKCRYGFHNKKDTKSGKRKQFMREGRKKGRYQ